MELNEKQIQILEVAEKLFAENGFDGASVRQIAKEADINIAMISYYFGSKEKLLEALLHFRTADFRMQIESVLSEEKDYLDTVDAIVKLVIERVHRNRRIYKIMHFEYSNLSRKLDFSSYIERKKENYELLENFVHKGQKAGVFTSDITIPLLVSTILGTYFNFYYNKRFFQALHGLESETSVDDYIFNVLTPHIQRTIKALLTYEN